MSFKEAIKTILKKKLQELDDEESPRYEATATQKMNGLMTILSHAFIPLEYVAELAKVNITDMRVWSDYDLIPTIEIEGKLYMTGEKVVHMLEDENHPLHIHNPEDLPLTPDLAMKRLIKAKDV